MFLFVPFPLSWVQSKYLITYTTPSFHAHGAEKIGLVSVQVDHSLLQRNLQLLCALRAAQVQHSSELEAVCKHRTLLELVNLFSAGDLLVQGLLCDEVDPQLLG